MVGPALVRRIGSLFLVARMGRPRSWALRQRRGPPTPLYLRVPVYAVEGNIEEDSATLRLGKPSAGRLFRQCAEASAGTFFRRVTLGWLQ